MQIDSRPPALFDKTVFPFCFLRIAEFYIGDPPTLNLEIMSNMATTTEHASADVTTVMITSFWPHAADTWVCLPTRFCSRSSWNG